MHRKDFIKISGLGITGFLLSNLFIYCSGKKITLPELLNKGVDDLALSSFKKEGDNYFSYYILEQNDFAPAPFKAKRAFVFVEQDKITAFTLQMEGHDKAREHAEELTQMYAGAETGFDNAFGKEYQWETDDRKIKLCFTRDYPGLAQYTFYSEQIKESRLICL